MIVGVGRINGVEAVVASMEYSFIGGSMGVVVGEKIVRGIELALERRAPVMIVSCSGGARMMEGALSLMQMAKISAALARLDRAKLPYISILTDPTTGGVTASFAMLGDLNIAEPKALIGFAGPARHRTDHPAEAAGRLPAQRVPARARHARPGGRSARDEGDDRPGPALHGAAMPPPDTVPPSRSRRRMTPLERLFALEQFGIKLGLDNIRTLLAALGNPERAWRSIHIAGTNGKGSVAAMVERGLRAAGLQTGRYTSPHLDRIEERVALDGAPVDRGDVRSRHRRTCSASWTMPRANGALTVSPTFFEVSTAVAFEIFRRAGGGRRDRRGGAGRPLRRHQRADADDRRHHVDRVRPRAASRHHAVGDRVRKGRHRQGGRAAGHRPAAAGSGGHGSPRSPRRSAPPIVDAHATTADRRYPPLTLALAGRHQLENAAVAVAHHGDVVGDGRRMSRPRPSSTGLTECEWPARLEWLRLPGGGELLIDAAHNPAGARRWRRISRTPAARLPIVFAVMDDKDLGGMIKALAPVASMFVATTRAASRARGRPRAGGRHRAQPAPVHRSRPTTSPSWP